MNGRTKRSFSVGKAVILSREEVLHVAKLALLTLTEEEILKFQGQLSEVLSYVGQLQVVDTRGIAETSQVTGLESVSREDKVDQEQCLSVKETLANATQTEKDYVKVKGVLKAK